MLINFSENMVDDVIVFPEEFSFGSERPKSATDPRTVIYARGSTIEHHVTSTLLNGLTAYWKLEEAPGNRIDATGNGNDAVPTNAPGNTAGKIGNAMALTDETLGYVSVANSPSIDLSTFTLAFWFRRSDVASWSAHSHDLLVKTNAPNDQGYYVSLAFSPAAVRINSFDPIGGSVVATGSILSDQWHLVAITYDRASDIATVRRKSADSESNAQGLLTYGGNILTSNPLVIGNYFPSVLTAGAIDELGIWNRVLTSAEKDELWNSGAGKTYPF